MIKAEHEFSLPVPPKEAFALLSDPAKDPDWQTACKSTRLLNGEARPGCQYEILFHMVGKKMQFTVEILDYEPGVLSRFKTLDGPFGYLGTYRYSEQSDGTTGIRWAFDVAPGDYFGVMPLSLVKKLLISQVKKDSGLLARTLAAQGADARA